MASGTETLKRTPLHERHAAAGARLVPFAGWEMPVQYEGIRREHVAVRTGTGMFDVSHMGEIETSGPGAEEFLQRILSNDVSKLAVGGAQYSVLCREDGGALDDLFTYRLGDDRYLTVTNASNHQRDLAWFQDHSTDFDVTVTDALADYAMLAVQGPSARAAVERLADGDRILEVIKVQDVAYELGDRSYAQGNHSVDMLIAYLPKEKILFNADLYSPPAEGAQPAPPTPGMSAGPNASSASPGRIASALSLTRVRGA